MKKAMVIALCAAGFITFNGCKKETAADKVEKQSSQQDNYVKKTANKYTQGITGAKEATKTEK